MLAELKILELAEYYCNRYDLEFSCTAANSSKRYEKYSTLNAELTRILKNTIIQKRSLWDIIDPKHRGEKGPRKISIEYFEHQCFPQLDKYIRANYNSFNEAALGEDKKRYNIYYEKERKWEDEAERAIAEHNAAIENEDFESANDIDDPIDVTPSDVEIKGYKMMIEAIYSIFYEPFEWAQLQMDMITSRPTDDGYNPNINKETMKALHRLEDFHNYTGQPKQIP